MPLSNSPRRRRSLALLLPLALLPLGPGCTRERSAAARPDVVVILVDTLRADRLGCYGYPRPTSPTLDALAARGVVFEDATVQAPWTLPSMVSLFSGRYVTSYRDALEPELPILARSFQSAGYRTLAVISNRLVSEQSGFAIGFDHFDERLSARPREEGVRQNRTIHELIDDIEGPLRAAAARDARGERAPVFLYVHAFDPHAPYFPHPEHDDLLPPSGAPPIEPPGWQEAMLAERGPAAPPGGWSAELQHLALERGWYDQEVRHFDEGLARLLGLLGELDLARNTIFALISDHGEELWEHLAPESAQDLATLPPERFFYRAHGGSSYQTVLSTPFVMWGAGIPPGLRIAEPVENIDLYPTLLDLADLAPPAGLHGRSLVTLLRGERGAPREAVHSYGEHATTLRESASGYKLIVPDGKRLANGWGIELYHLPSDPHERTNLAEQQPKELERLARMQREWFERHPTDSNLAKGQHRAAALRAELLQRLAELGYTEMETGIDVGAERAHADEH